jgi:hypothetical protein
VIAFNQIEQKKLDPKTLVNVLDPLLDGLRKRPGIVYLKRLTIILDEDSEKGFGLVRHFVLYVIGKRLKNCHIDECKYLSCATLRSFSLGTHHSRNILFSMLDPFAAFSPDGTYNFLAIDTSPASVSSQTYTSQDSNQKWRSLRDRVFWGAVRGMWCFY